MNSKEANLFLDKNWDFLFGHQKLDLHFESKSCTVLLSGSRELLWPPVGRLIYYLSHSKLKAKLLKKTRRIPLHGNLIIANGLLFLMQAPQGSKLWVLSMSIGMSIYWMPESPEKRQKVIFLKRIILLGQKRNFWNTLQKSLDFKFFKNVSNLNFDLSL